MEPKNPSELNREQQNKHAGAGQGRQGVDKAPGEETPSENVQFETEAFKGKKVDADPSKEEDRPADQPSI